MKHQKLDIAQQKIDHPFNVEKDYFEKAQARIIDQVAEPAKAPFALKWAMIPAFVIVLMASFYLISNYNQTTSVNDLLAEVSTEDIFDYLEENEISEEDLAMLVAEQNIEFSPDLYLNELEIDENDMDDLLQEYDLENMIQDI